jgi:hypothetical protein
MNVNNNGFGTPSKVQTFGADGQMVTGQLEGSAFDRFFVPDSIQKYQSGNQSLIPTLLQMPILPPPSTAASQPVSLSNLVNTDSNTNFTPNQTSSNTQLSDQQAIYERAFSNQLNQDTSLTDADKAKLLFAFYNPPSNETLSDGTPVQQTLGTIVTQAQAAAAAQGVNVATLNPPVDNTAFNLNISDGLNNAFEQAVSNSTLTPAQQAALLFAHYNPGVPIPNMDANFQTQLAGIEATALQQTIQQFGLPPDYKPALNSKVYNGALNGDFSVNLQMAFDDQTQNLSSDDQQAVKNAIQNMNDPSVPANIKQIAQSIINKASTQTQTDNSLPVGYQPTADQLNDIFNQISSNPATNAFVQTREQINSIYNQLIILVPDGPGKAITMSMLQAISAAIITAQNTIYGIEQANSEMAKQEGVAKLGMQDQQIREQQEQAATLAQQIGQQQKMQTAMAVLGPIMKVFEVVMALATGGALAMVFAILDASLNLSSKLVTAISQGVTNLVNQSIPSNDPNSARLKAGLEVFGQVVALSAVLAAGGTILFQALGATNLMNLGMQTVSGSSVIQDFCTMCGIPQSDVPWVVLAVTLTITIAVTAITFYNPAEAGEQALTDLPEVAEESMQAAEDSTESVSTTMNNVLDVSQSSGRIADTINGASSNVDDAETAMQASQTATETAQEAEEGASNSVNNVLDTVLNQINDQKVYDKFMDFLNDSIKIADNLTKASNAEKAMQAGQVIQTIIGAANSALQGGVSIVQANMATSKGQHDAVVTELEAMIKMLQKILNSILQSLSSLGDDLKDTKDVLNNMFSTAQQTLNKTTAIQMS